MKKLLLVAFIIRIILAIIQAYTAIDLPGAGADSLAFEKHAWDYARAWHSGDYSTLPSSAYRYYSALIGFCYYYFGRIELIPQLINVSFGLLIIYVTYNLTKILSSCTRTALIAAFLAAFSPTLMFYSSILLREILIICFLLLSFYYFVKWLESNNYIYMISSFIATMLSALFHGSMLFISWVHLLCFGLYSSKEKSFRIAGKYLFVVGFMLLSLVLLLNLDIITYKAPTDLQSLVSLESFQNIVGNRTIGRTQYLEGFIPKSYFDVLWHTPIRSFYFMFTPFPWMVKTAGDLLFLSDVLIYILLLYFSAAGFKRLYNNNKVAVVSLLLIVASIVVLFAWGTVNYGTAWRHRAKIAPFLTVLASVGLAMNPRFNWLFPDDPVGSDELLRIEA